MILLFVPILTLVEVVWLYHDIPWGDNLTLFVDNHMAEGMALAHLFRFHNEHLIVPTKLAVYADYRLWHGANILPALLAVACVIGIISVYSRTFRRCHREMTAAQTALMFSLLAAILLNGRLTWTLTCPVLLTHVSANVLVTVTLAAYAAMAAGSVDERRRLVSWVVFLAAGIAAVTASASGVLAMPAAVSATIFLVAISPAFRRRPWRKPAVLAALLGAALLTAYFAAYATGSPPRSTVRSLHVGKAAQFALYFLGGAFLRDSDWPLVNHPNGLVLHTVVLGFWAAFAWVVVETWRRRKTLGEFELFHAAMLAFVIVTAATGGLFRSGLGDLEALNKKYAPTALLAWASVASLVLHYRSGWLFGQAGTTGLRALVLAIAVVLAILPGDMFEFRAWGVWRRQLREAVVAFASGVQDEILLLRFFPNARMARDMVAEIQGNAAYSFRELPRLGGSLDSMYTLVPAAQQAPIRIAAADSPVSGDPEARVARGQLAIDAGECLPNVIVTDDGRRVIGYGNASHIGSDGRRLEQAEWFATYRQQQGQRVLLYSVDEGSASLIGELRSMAGDPCPVTDARVGTRLPRVPDHRDFGIEFINDVATPQFKPPARFAVTDVVRFLGWAVDNAAGSGPVAVEIVIDGRSHRAEHCLQRPDVAEYLQNPGFVQSGFQFALPAAQLGLGNHEVCMRIFLADGESFLETPTFSFMVE
jgi:hypothetical protein